jgi:Putative Actinobacterial Holin-X, holin superfamily III
MAQTEDSMAQAEPLPAEIERDVVESGGRRHGSGSIADLTRRVRRTREISCGRSSSWPTKTSPRRPAGPQPGGLFGAAALVGYLALGTLVATAVLGLATVVDAWLAALIVALVLAAVTALLALVGRARLQAGTPPVPPETVQRVKEDLQWVKEHATSGEK